MSTTKPIRERIKNLKGDYDRLRVGKEALLVMLDEAEVPESVYNSNAIENSTLTLKETERILLEMEVSREVSVREVFEAKNLGRVMEYIRDKVSHTELTKELILLLHRMLIGNINDRIAGRFRAKGEYVRVGTHVAPGPEHVERMVDAILSEYSADHESYFVDKIAKFHLDFENIHPFNDGNGRIGRAIVNYQLGRSGLPVIIIRNKEKKGYYRAFSDYLDSSKKNAKTMEKVVSLALLESLHKRITYLRGETIITLADYAKKARKSPAAFTNAARRQATPAFREKGVWKIGKEYSG